ncbi:MAG TPA: glutamine-hydrolyzing carbamoyl-phosphate synthase small subunit [Phycisphaerales bacterium]|nr:glutamine-hydrolyzing carbamoyl-phosphate synthase small subunit [Phycisphaerales bacterium]
MPSAPSVGSDKQRHDQGATRVSARLALADGTVFEGDAFGAVGRRLVSIGEVVFNTAMAGYQESLTDPSYTGQILVQTFPLIGNTGANEDDRESRKVQVAGFVIRELARRHSNYRATTDLSTYLQRAGVLGIAGIDTRALTRKIRSAGATQGVLTDRADLSDADLVARAANAPSMAGQNLVPLVGCSSRQTWSETLGDWAPRGVRRAGRPLRVLTLDCGAKANILRNLSERGCEVVVVPHDTPARDITAMYERGEVDGLFISNGPGDPAAVQATIDTLRELMNRPAEKTMPTFGICLGHQLLALAVGARTYKLPFGHRGANHPILQRGSGRVEITSQNHGFAVDRTSLAQVGGTETHTHLNDDTVAGFRVEGKPVFCVQYHPEASPGPHDSGYLFDEFVRLMRGRRSDAEANTR